MKRAILYASVSSKREHSFIKSTRCYQVKRCFPIFRYEQPFRGNNIESHTKSAMAFKCFLTTFNHSKAMHGFPHDCQSAPLSMEGARNRHTNATHRCTECRFGQLPVVLIALLIGRQVKGQPKTTESKATQSQTKNERQMIQRWQCEERTKRHGEIYWYYIPVRIHTSLATSVVLVEKSAVGCQFFSDRIGST